MKNIKKYKYIIIGIAIIILIIGIIFIIKPFGNKSNNNQEEQKEPFYFESGVFANNGKEIRIIVNEKSLTINNIVNGYTSIYNLFFNEGEFVNDAENPTITIKSEKEKTIELISNIETLENGTYVKTKDYSSEDMLKDRFGDTTYLYSDLSGKYVFNKTTLYLVQISEKTILIRFNDEDYTTGLDKNEEGLYVNNFTKLEVEIKKDGDNLTLKSDKEVFNGTFKKEKSLTDLDIINNFIDL